MPGNEAVPIHLKLLKSIINYTSTDFLGYLGKPGPQAVWAVNFNYKTRGYNNGMEIIKHKNQNYLLDTKSKGGTRKINIPDNMFQFSMSL